MNKRNETKTKTLNKIKSCKMTTEEAREARPKIEVVRVPSIERASFRPLDGVQLRAAYSHVRVGTYCPGLAAVHVPPSSQLGHPALACHKRLVSREIIPKSADSRKYKKNLGPVSRLLRRRGHHSSGLATKSCDNIYCGQKSAAGNCHEQAFHGRQSNSLDWRMNRSLDRTSTRLDTRKASRSAEQLSKNAQQQTPNAKSKLVSLLRRLSPRLPRPTNNKGSTTNICPWLQVEYSTTNDEPATIDEPRSDEPNQKQNLQSPHIDADFERELELSELRKKTLNSEKESIDDLSSTTEDIKNQQLVSKPSMENNEESSVVQSKQAVHEERASPEELNRSEVAGLATPPESRLVSCSNGSGAKRSRPYSLAVQPLNYQRLDPDSAQPHHQAAKVPLSQATKITANKSNNNNTNSCNRNRKNKSDKSAHRKMTSQESIGSCSLDVEKSASERSGSHQHHHDNKEITAGSLSEKTLHSLSLSCNGDRTNSNNHNNSNNNIINGNGSDNNRSNNNNSSSSDRQSALSNGHAENEQQSEHRTNGHSQQEQPDDLVDGDQQLTASKKPSYLGLACSINGYTNITCYDSKLREGFRSRDTSPGASRLITRDSHPAGFRPHENLYSHQSYLTVSGNKSISPLAMDRYQHNGFSNGVRESKYKLETTTTTTTSGTSTTRTQHVEEGYSEVDRGLSNLNHSIDSFSPICSNSPKKRINSPVASRVHAYNQQNASFSSVTSSSPKLTVKNGSHNASFNDSNMINGSSDGDSGMLNCSSSSEKSFIQQRVERLYGPGALAQGFFFKRSSSGSPRLNTSDDSNNSSNKSNNNNLIEETNDEESLRTLPVLRHLRPEFRAQLPVVSPRKATDGTEQIIKPLKRLSVAENTETKKVSTKGTTEKLAAPADIIQNEKSISMIINSMQSTDQLPAAPKVVLPAAETAESSSISIKEDDFEKNVPVKDGHYFMNLLNIERNRLISLAESAEKELDSNAETELPEEAAGKLRSAAGKARLLATQKMKQFEGLCQKNINQEPGEEFPTTSEDLAGFWDMVSLQIVQVHQMFELLEQSRQAQWQEIVPEIKSIPATPVNGNTKRRYQTPSSKSKSSASASARKARETRDQTRRQLIEERRRAMRSLNTNKAENVEIFVPES